SVPVPVRRPRVLREAAPAPAAIHPGGSPDGTGWVVGRGLCVIRGGVPIPAPFIDVPVHVEETEPVGPLLAHGMGLFCRVSIKPRILAQARRVIAEAVPPRAPRPARVLPLCLRRQPVPIAPRPRPRAEAIVRLQPFRLAQLVAERDRV